MRSLPCKWRRCSGRAAAVRVIEAPARTKATCGAAACGRFHGHSHRSRLCWRLRWKCSIDARRSAWSLVPEAFPLQSLRQSFHTWRSAQVSCVGTAGVLEDGMVVNAAAADRLAVLASHIDIRPAGSTQVLDVLSHLYHTSMLSFARFRLFACADRSRELADLYAWAPCSRLQSRSR